MADRNKFLVKVIALILIMGSVTICLVSFALAARDQRFYPSNLSVTGIPFANLENEIACGRLRAVLSNKNSNDTLKIYFDKIGEMAVIPINECGIAYNYEKTIEEIDKSVNRENGLISSLNHVIFRGKKQDFSPAVSLIDKELLINKLNEIKLTYDKDAFNACVLYKNEQLEYIKHENGFIMDELATLHKIEKAVEERKLGSITVAGVESEPYIKSEDLKPIKDLIALDIININNNDEEFDNNMRRIMQKVDGCIIMPGDKLSMQELFRNEEDLSSKSMEIISNIIYQAALQTQVMVNKESWDSKHINSVLLENNSKTPVLLSIVKEDNKIILKIFGSQKQAGKEICRLIEKDEISPGVEMKTDYSLLPAERIIKQEGEKGCRLKEFRLVKQNGKEIEKKLLVEEIKSPKNTIILVGPGTIKK